MKSKEIDTKNRMRYYFDDIIGVMDRDSAILIVMVFHQMKISIKKKMEIF